MRFRDEQGQVMVFTLLCMTCLLGFVALATDVALMLRAKRVIQSVADCGAIAGAAEINWASTDSATPSNAITAAAKKGTAKNGFTDGSGGVTVSVNYPPTSGAHIGDGSFVEVYVTQTQPTIFMKLFSIFSMPVSARAVAGLGAISSTCGYVLDKTAKDAMQLQGSFNVDAPTCGFVIDSNSGNALEFTGKGNGALTAAYVGVVGGDSGQTGDSKPNAPVLGIAPVNDPLGYISPPTPTGCQAAPGGTLTGTIGPAAAKGTICYSGNVTLSNVTLQEGTYVFTGNVTLSGNVDGTAGVTLDIASGTFAEDSHGGTYMNLKAPIVADKDSTSPYASIALMQPYSNTNTLTFDFGCSGGTLDGIIYAPAAQLFMQDSGCSNKYNGLTLTTDLIVGTLYDKTASLTLTSFSQTNPSSTPLKVPVLVE